MTQPHHPLHPTAHSKHNSRSDAPAPRPAVPCRAVPCHAMPCASTAAILLPLLLLLLLLLAPMLFCFCHPAVCLVYRYRWFSSSQRALFVYFTISLPLATSTTTTILKLSAANDFLIQLQLLNKYIFVLRCFAIFVSFACYCFYPSPTTEWVISIFIRQLTTVFWMVISAILIKVRSAYSA